MTIDIPGWLKSVAWAAATDWPEADEDALRRMSDAFRAAAQELGAVSEDGNHAAERVLGAVQGQTHVAFHQYWDKVTDGSGALIPQLQDMLESVADECEGFALEVEYTKMSIIAALAMLAAQITLLVANAIETFGASTLAIPLAQLATRLGVQQLMRKLLTSVAERAVTTLARDIAVSFSRNLLANVGVDAAIQSVQVLSGDRKDWDVSKTNGAVISAGVGTVTDIAGGEVTAKVGPSTEGNRVAHLAGTSAISATVAGLGSAADVAAHGDTDLEKLGRGALSGSVAGSLNGGRSAVNDIGDTGPVPIGTPAVIVQSGNSSTATTPPEPAGSPTKVPLLNLPPHR